MIFSFLPEQASGSENSAQLLENVFLIAVVEVSVQHHSDGAEVHELISVPLGSIGLSVDLFHQ